MNAATAIINAKFNAKIDAWKARAADLAEARKHCTVITGQPFVVVNDGLTVRVQGNTATPIAIVPGCAGASHFDRKDAARVASLMGDGWQVVAAADVGEIEIARLTSLIELLCAAA